MQSNIFNPHENKIHSRVFALKYRLSAKRIEAGMLFSDITNGKGEGSIVKSQLETIRELLIKQQEFEGSLQ